MTQQLSDADIAEQLLPRIEEVFGEEALEISAPGGRDRDSLRVTLSGKTVIATRRQDIRRRDIERIVLDRLGTEGAPVPHLLGSSGAWTFQTDAGGGRLTAELSRRDAPGRHSLARRAISALWEIKAAAHRVGLNKQMPSIALSLDWMQPFALGPVFLSKALALDIPRYGWQPLMQGLAALPTGFVKWDARPGNAAVQHDGSVIWYDWETSGVRRGCEDFGFLFSDEFWPLTPMESVALFADTCPKDVDAMRPLLVRFATLQIVTRLRQIQAEWLQKGWSQEETAMRYDHVGATPRHAARLTAHGAEMAALDDMTEPLVEWFEDVGIAFRILSETD